MEGRAGREVSPRRVEEVSDWKDVPVTAGMLAEVLDSCMSDQNLMDFNMAGLMDLISGALENAARIKCGMEPLP